MLRQPTYILLFAGNLFLHGKEAFELNRKKWQVNHATIYNYHIVWII